MLRAPRRTCPILGWSDVCTWQADVHAAADQSQHEHPCHRPAGPPCQRAGTGRCQAPCADRALRRALHRQRRSGRHRQPGRSRGLGRPCHAPRTARRGADRLLRRPRRGCAAGDHAGAGAGPGRGGDARSRRHRGRRRRALCHRDRRRGLETDAGTPGRRPAAGRAPGRCGDGGNVRAGLRAAWHAACNPLADQPTETP